MKSSISLGLTSILALSCALSITSAQQDSKHVSDEEQGISFQSTLIKAPFLEQFSDNWTERWHASHAKKESVNDGDSYIGQWVVEEPQVFPGLKGDLGLVAKTAAAHHAISALIPEVIDNTGKTLVVQYEVKPQNGLICGGAYIKLLTDSTDGIKFKEFSNETPYTIMFGPDKCGTTDKVHFIFRHKNPITGIYEEKHLKNAPLTKLGKISNLYTLVVEPDQTFEIKINGKVASSGSLLEDFLPAVNPPQEIDDSNDTKPANWVDDEKIVDSSATKPEDWDEDAPARILDQSAVKPEDWLEDAEAEIPDPDSTKPEDWDDEEDGDWVPPSVPNPKCQASGCGKWERPLISNPAYRGKWTPPLVDNPDYKGEWKPRKIANPEYFEDQHPSNFDKISAVGFEIWTVQSDILFDNIYIGHSAVDAESLAAESWELKYKIEKQLEDEANPKPEPAVEDSPKTFTEDPLGYIYGDLKMFYELAREDPMDALNRMPLVVAVLAGVVGVSFGLMLIILGLMSGDPEAQKKVSEAKKKDSASEVNTEEKQDAGATSGDSSVRKRTAVAESEN
ncbi:hypothetical protein BGZ76_011161 [Entomortierella beljakovae]|nr:hypothetical protein BGZ76_011161 [Entomortierella beljakovae]